jgi:hypothetical protein
MSLQERLVALEREKAALQQQLAAAAATDGVGTSAAGPSAAAGAGAPVAASGALGSRVSGMLLPAMSLGTVGAACGALRHSGSLHAPASAAVEETLRHELHTQREVAARLRLEASMGGWVWHLVVDLADSD